MSTAEATIPAAEVEVFTAKPPTFPETKERLELIKADYLKLEATDLTDKEVEKVIHEALKHAVDLRLKIEVCRENAKSPALKFGRMVDAQAKELTATLAPAEDHLRIEDKKFKAEAERLRKIKDEAKAAATQARMDALLAVGETITFALAGALEEEAYQERLQAATVAHEEKLAKEAAEEAERQRLAAEAEKARLEEVARLEAQRVEQEKLAAELKKQQEEIAAQQREIAAAQQAEADRLAAERKKLEDAKAAEEKRVADAEAAEERKAESARMKKQAEIDAKAKIEREAAAKAEKERKAEERRLAKEAKRPDKEKVIAWADWLSEIELPALSPAAETHKETLRVLLDAFVVEVRGVAGDFDAEGDE